MTSRKIHTSFINVSNCKNQPDYSCTVITKINHFIGPPECKILTQPPLHFYSYRATAEAVVLGIDPKTVTPSLQINFNFNFCFVLILFLFFFALGITALFANFISSSKSDAYLLLFGQNSNLTKLLVGMKFLPYYLAAADCFN